MRQNELIRAINLLVTHHDKIDKNMYLHFQEEMREIGNKTEGMECLKASRDEQIQSLIMTIEQAVKEITEPSLPFEKERRSTTERSTTDPFEKSRVKEWREEEDSDVEERKEILIDEIIDFYASIDPGWNEEEIREDLIWKSEKEIEKILKEIKNNSEEKLNTEIAAKVYMRKKNRER